MRNAMTKGYVFRLTSGFYGVISYAPQTTVQIYVSERDNYPLGLFDVCREMGRKFAGAFDVADRDTEAWGKVVYRAQGSALVLHTSSR